MADFFSFELVSPERLLLSKDAGMVVIPGAEGDFGVLVGHTPLISALRPGVIDVYVGDTVDERIFVAGGFAEVTGARCTVLAEEAVPIDEINQMTAQVRSSAALEAIDNATNAAALTQAEAELAVAEAMVSAAKTI
ncbi:MAG: F0F1 ATP synthase subunit epsilon [Pseudomonadota bacterium]|nr:F0F1 ATP synthase subunit epsilon [Pseudomonadota bacterium]